MSTFVKKMCVLKQMRNGFSSDGNPLNGLIKAEVYGNRIKSEAALINFAPLSDGNYCLVLSDRFGETFSCPLTHTGGYGEGKTQMDLSSGFLAVICYADSREYRPIAYGVNGENVYEIGSLLLKLFSFKHDTSLSAVYEDGAVLSSAEKTDKNTIYYNKDREVEFSSQIQEQISEKESGISTESYNDEALAKENFYEFSPNNEIKDNLLSSSVLHAFKICGGDTYYQSVRSELDDVFNANPTDDSLKRIFPYSLWVRIAEGKDKGDLVGVILEKLTVRYVCYAKKKGEGTIKPAHACEVPVSFFKGEKESYFVTFRDADTGEYAEVEDV